MAEYTEYHHLVNAGQCGASVSKLQTFQPPRRRLLSVNEVTTVVGSLWYYFVGTNLAS